MSAVEVCTGDPIVTEQKILLDLVLATQGASRGRKVNPKDLPIYGLPFLRERAETISELIRILEEAEADDA